jgi:hypothetical protein
LAQLTQEYKYLSIENRTLLNTKTKLVDKELECAKIKSERDMFKKKLIELHRKKAEEEEDEREDSKEKGTYSL